MFELTSLMPRFTLDHGRSVRAQPGTCREGPHLGHQPRSAGATVGASGVAVSGVGTRLVSQASRVITMLYARIGRKPLSGWSAANRRVVRPQRDEDRRLEREQHEQQRRPMPTIRRGGASDEGEDQDQQHQVSERVAEVAMRDERARIVKDPETGEEDLDHRAHREGAGGEGERPSRD